MCVHPRPVKPVSTAANLFISEWRSVLDNCHWSLLSCYPGQQAIQAKSQTRQTIINTTSMTVDDKSFFLFAQTNPEKAREHIAAVREVTGKEFSTF